MSSSSATLTDAGLDPAEIARRVDAVFADPLYWFPVRHHSPTTARHVQSAIAARRPKVIFIEGPFEANDLIPFVTDPATAPPVAIYSSYRDDDNVLGLNGHVSPAADIPARFAVWYPLTPYSPEYVAMKTAATVKAAVVFIDLPHYARVERHVPEPQGQQPPREAPSVAPDEDRLITSSGFYKHLAEAAGFKSWSEAWDTLFENPEGTDYEAFRRELATFCAAARATADHAAEHAEGTVERERHFLKVIADTLAARKLKPADAMVVCGGFHLFLDRDDKAAPPPCPEGTVYTTVVPYSYFRISELSGYGAGNRAPQFYQTCYDLTAAGRASDIAMEHAIAVLRTMRKGGDPLSTADAISVTHHAGMLARLRGRAHPTLDDISDALVTCCCKGNPNEEGRKLRDAMDQAGIGNRIGKVTSKIGRLPIVNDFHAQIADLELGEVLGKEKKMSAKLDKRDPLAARRSAFLHRVSYLKVPFAAITGTGGDFSGTLFREEWHLKWDPRTEPALIEQNLYGDTVESAALNRLREALAEAGSSAGQTCARLLEAVDMDMPDLVSAAEDACGPAVDTDPSFASQATALQYLGRLEQYAAFRGLRRDVIAELLNRCFDRACFALPNAANVPEEEQQGVVDGLIGLAEVVLRDGVRYDRTLFAQAAQNAAAQSTVPFLRGAFLGLLCEIRVIAPGVLAAEVSNLAQASTEVMVTAGDLLDGMLAVSRTSLMLGADALVTAIDDLLKAAEWDPFLVMLPRLRAAIERLSNPQKDALAATVARHYGLDGSTDLRAVSGSLGATALVARLDAAVAATLRNWPL
ncbi:hypothetical protein GobsT_70210 [Gemmata obscuriglobus]|uniref:DUF5682 family protein n=1 Tax=Gemmata obscuriglobus TaxID=114 RepID=UPI0011CCF78C|nr:DUF5682 family protein [Gemmata obscuriglobus]QEG32169.1 hypothetical protein GobsT_70210 [Gemmata obscuriglobus]VTS11522.1 Uncharacterized protein OS=Cystobacter violaceus Cb vi76 GN=Q664_20170 PE=4 SV=1 [Gemmata obscuriglobus UQM 2246]